MMSKSPTNVENFPKKMIYTALAGVFIVIGVIGLVVPVIPGILFIIGAVLLLSQVSSRVRQWSETQPWMHQVRVRMIQLGGLRPLEKTRFLLLLTVKNIVAGAESVYRKIRRLTQR